VHFDDKGRTGATLCTGTFKIMSTNQNTATESSTEAKTSVCQMNSNLGINYLSVEHGHDINMLILYQDN